MQRLKTHNREPAGSAPRRQAKRVLFAILQQVITTPVSLYTRAHARIHAFVHLVPATVTLLVLMGTFASLGLVRPATTAAATANTINFQARLMNASGSIVADGSYNVEFKLYKSAAAGASAQGVCVGGVTDDCQWMETRTGGNVVTVANGYLTVNLGSVTNFPSSFNWGQQLWLTMRIGGTGAPSWDTEMSPRLNLTAVPAAYSLTQYNTGNGFSSSLSINAPTGGNQTFQIQDQGAAGTYTLLTTNTANTNFIQNQNAGAQTSSNFWISGTGRADTALQSPSLDVATAGALGLGTSTATSVSLGKAGITTTNNGALTVTQAFTVNGGATVNTGTGNQLSVTSGANVGTVDQVVIDNTGAANGQTNAGVNNLSLKFKGQTTSAAVENGSLRIDITPGTVSGNVTNGLRVVQAATGPATGVTSNGEKQEGPTTGGAGTFNGINIANIGAVASGGIVRGINITGTNSNAAGTVRGIQLNNLTAGAASEIGIDLGTGWDNLLTYNNGATVIVNGSGQLNVANVTGTLPNANLTNSGALTVTAGTGLSGGGSVALGASTTLNLANTTVSAASYGSASSVATFTVNAQGQLTTAASTAIAINGNQITSGVVGAGFGGTGQSSYAVGDLLYASAATTLSKLAAVATGSCLISQGVTTAPVWGSCTTLTATNGLNIASNQVGLGGTLANSTTNLTSGGTSSSINITSGANVPAVDQLSITNTGSTGVTASGVNNLSLNFKGAGASAIESGASRIDIQAGSFTGSVFNGERIVANATGPATGVTLNASKIEGPATTGGAGTFNAINVANIGAVASGGIVRGINITGTNSNAAGTVRGIQLNNITSGGASEIGIDLGTGWDNLLTYNNGATVIVNGSGQLNVANVTGTLPNANLTNSGALTVTAGTGLSGGGSVALGASTTLNLANTTVSAASYGSASSVATFTVNAQGQLTTAASTAIAINGNQITSGVVGAGFGGTGQSSYAVGDLLYASAATTLSKLADVATGSCLISGGVGVAPAWGSCTSLTATNGLNIASNQVGLGGTLANSTTNLTSGGTSSSINITSGANVPAVDQFVVSNTGSTGVTTAGVSAVQISYKGGAAAVESSAQRIDLQPGGTGGGTWNALRIVQNATGPATGVTSNGEKHEGPTTGGAGTFNAINIANIGAVASGGVVRGVNITGTNSQAAGTVRGIQLNNLTAGAASEIGIDLGTGWDNLLTYNNGATVIVNGSGQLNVANVTGTLPNANLTNSGALTVTAGTGLSGGGSVALGASTTLNLANTTVSAASYGSASSVATFTVNAQGQLTTAASTAIAINGNQITSGVVGAGFGGTGQSSYAVGDLLYASAATTISKLADVASGSCLVSGGVGVAPAWGSCSNLSLGAVDSAGAANANGATLTGSVLNLNSADATNPGIINANAQTFGGAKTFNAKVIAAVSGGTALAVSGTPTATATVALILVGGNPLVGGNNSANGGTYFGLNAPGAGAGSAADFLNFQANGVAKLVVTNAGNVTAAGTLTVQGTSVSIGPANQLISFAAGAGNHDIEVGRTDGVSSTPVIDFHSNSTAVDYDVRLTSSSGSGVSGGGALTIAAQSTLTSGTLTVQGAGGSSFAGNLAVTAGGLTVTGNSTIAGTLGSLTGLSSSGTITFSGLSTNGVVTVSGGTLGSTAILGAANGGTGNGFTAFTGPTTSTKTFTLPDASATILTTNAAVTAVQGGTGLTSYAIGDLLYANTTTTLGKLAAVASGSCLISAGTNTAPTWGSCTTLTATNGLNIASNQVGLGGTLSNATTTITSGGAASSLSLTTGANVPTADQLAITNTGSTGVATSGVNNLSLNFKGAGASAIEAGASRIDIQAGSFTGSIFNGERIVANATGPATGVTLNASKIEGPATTGGAGTFNGINIANIGAVASGGVVRGINITGTNSNAAGTVRGIQLNNLTAGVASEIGIDLGTGWDNLLTYNNGATVIINGSGQLNVANVTGTLPNANLTNSGALTVTAGTGLSGGGSVALGASTTLNLANTTVSAASYGSASSVATFTVNAQGQLTTAASTSIAINGNQITSGVVGAGFGGTGQSSYAVGDLLYASAATTLSKLAAVATGSCLISQGVTTAPVWGSCTTLTATNGLNIASNQVGLGGTLANSTTSLTSGGTSSSLNITSGANVPAIDQLSITNTGSTGVTASGVNNLSLNFKGAGASAIEAGASRIDIQAGSFSGSTFNGERIVANATGPATGVTLNGSKIEGPATTGGAGTFNAINIANIGTVASGGVVRGINITGTNSNAAGTVRGIQLNNLTAGAASEIGIDLGTGWDNLLTYNNGATVIVNGSGQLNVANVTGTLPNANLTNSGALTVTAGTGLSGGGSVALGASTTLNLANTTVSAASYGSASSVATFTVNAQGQLTTAASTAIAINGNQITSGVVGAGFGGTGQSSYAVGDLLYASAATTLSKLADVATGSCLISGGVGVAPSWGACSALSLGTYSTSNTDAHGATLSGGVLTFQDASASAPGMISTGTQTLAGNKTFSGFTTLQPAANLTNGQIGLTQTATFANATASGVVTGFLQNITVSSSTAATNKAHEITVTDNSASVGHTNYGLKVTLAGSNANYMGYGGDFVTGFGIGVRGVSSAQAVTSGTCADKTSTLLSIGVCADSSASNPGYGLYARAASGLTSANPNSGASGGVAVYGTNTAGGAAGQSYTGVSGVSLQTNAGAYISTGVYGQAQGSGTGTVYGGYFQVLNSGTNGAVIQGVASSYSGNLLQLLNGATPEFTVGNTGSTTIKTSSNSASALLVQNASSASVLTADTLNTKVVVGGDTNVGTVFGNRLFSDNFESGTFGLWNRPSQIGAGSTFTADTTQVHNGKYAAKEVTTGNVSLVSTALNPSSSVYFHANVYVSSHTAGNLDLMDFTPSAAPSTGVTLYRAISNGHLWLWNNTASIGNDTGQVLPTGGWHYLEVQITNGNPGTIQVWMDGTRYLNITTQNLGTNPIDIFDLGESSAARTGTVFYDDVAVDSGITTSTPAASLSVQDSLHVGGTSTFGNGVLIQPATNSSTALQVRDSSGNLALAVDTVNSALTVQSNAANSSVSRGSIVNATTCSGTNWSGTGPWTHTAGSAAVLTCTPPASVTSGAYYEVTYTTSTANGPNDGIMANIGGGLGTFTPGSITQDELIKAVSTTSLTFTPSSAWAGTISSVSVQQLTPTQATFKILNSGGFTALEVHANDAGESTFIGESAGMSMDYGYENTGVGYLSQRYNIGGGDNSSLGAYSLQGNSMGSYNTAVGSYALQDNTIGSSNTAVGHQALIFNVSGNMNTGLGREALRSLVYGDNNIAIGANAGDAQTSGSNNIIIGTSVNAASLTGSNQLQIGSYISGATGGGNSASVFKIQNASAATSLNVDTTSTGTVLTVQANTDSRPLGSEIMTSSYTFASAGWTAISGTGQSATATHTTGNTTSLDLSPTQSYTVGAQYQLKYTISGNTNGGQVCPNFGGSSGPCTSATSGTFTLLYTPPLTNSLKFDPASTFNGTVTGVSIKLFTGTIPAALSVKNASGTVVFDLTVTSDPANLFLGNGAGSTNTGASANTGVGYNALHATTIGVNNTGLGYSALGSNISGSSNTALGSSALSAINGNYNVAVGASAGRVASSGDYNSLLGYQSGNSLTSGSQNLLLGAAAGANITSGSNNVILGYNVNAPNATASNQLQIGSIITGDISSANGYIQIGSQTTDSNQNELVLDSYNTYADAASTCASGTNNGGMYYNTVSNSIRACIKDTINTTYNWEDLPSTAGLGAILFGVVPDSGLSADQGDWAALGGATKGPCKVSWASSTSVSVAPCVAYSQGRKVIVSSATTVSSLNGNTLWYHICLNGTGNAPVATTGNASETANIPTFSANNPVLCLADVKTGASSTITNIYDYRTFTTTTKEFVTNQTTLAGLGQMVSVATTTPVANGVTQTPNTGNSTANLRGVVVAQSSATSTTTITTIIAVAGPQWVKLSAGAGALNQTLGGSATAGYAGVGNAAPAIYAILGLQLKLSDNATCNATTNCQMSVPTDIKIR